MPFAIRVVTSAEQEIREAAVWWQANRPAARNLFHDEIKRGFELVTAHPGIGPQSLNTTLQGVRRLLIYRINYYLYYRVEQETVEILALWHTRMGQGPML